MNLIDDGPALREERHHLAIAWFVRLLVVRPTNHKKRTRTRTRLPARPGTSRLAKTSFDPERPHQRVVESQRTFEIADTDEDM